MTRFQRVQDRRINAWSRYHRFKRAGMTEHALVAWVWLLRWDDLLHWYERQPTLIKACGCGCGYTPEQWETLPLIGTMDDGDGGTMHLRDCLCGSTLGVSVDATGEIAHFNPENWRKLC